MKTIKPRVIIDYVKLPLEVQEQIKLQYPHGFSQNLIEFANSKGGLVTALPFETDDKKYMIRMSSRLADKLIELDDDYDDDGLLKEDVHDILNEKYANAEFLEEEI